VSTESEPRDDAKPDEAPGGLDWSSAPCVLGPNQPPRPYLGGAGIARLRGVPRPRPDSPEDFVGSTVEVGPGGMGLTRMTDGRTLRDHILAGPEAFLGPAHVAEFGADPALLVKLLDTGERLFVHFHPDQAFAARHLDCRHGKSEAWVVTDVVPEPGESAGFVYLGFRRPVPEDEVRGWIEHQQVEEMLAALNRIPVRPGDTFFVPGGTPHAIGAGVTAIELQEPTDFSILLEQRAAGADGGHLGLGWDTALAALDRSAWDTGRLAGLCPPPRETADPQVGRYFPAEADRFFRAEQLVCRTAVSFGPEFSILVVLSGEGVLTAGGSGTPLRRGVSVLVPYGAGECRITGQVAAVRCLPPLPRGTASGPSAAGPA
jgi:mannose-6-phosphate isomerase